MGTDDADGALTIDGHRFWCCTAIGCDNIASIVVQSGTWFRRTRTAGYTGTSCACRSRQGNALYVPDRPDCFHTDCQTPAVSVMTHLDGTFLPVCEAHLDDLSWVSPTPSELLELKLR